MEMDNFEYFLEASKEEFFQLANLQRDLPEKAMLKFQFAMGGGIMNTAIEHIGDLSHRMSEKPTFGSAGYEFVKDKVKRCLMWLTNPYGFDREFQENIRNNAKYMKIDEEEFRQKLYGLLDNYAKEHAKLPYYNEAQRLAIDAAVSLGKRQFDKTIWDLEQLQSHLNSKEDWVNFAHQHLDS